MKAEKLPSGKYRVRATKNKVTKSFIDANKREAMRKANEWLYMASNIESGNISLDTAIDEYIKSKSSVLSPSTIRSYKTIHKNHFQSLLPYKIDKITSNLIQVELNNMTTKGLSPKTVKNAYGLLSAVFDMFLPSVKFKVSLPQKRQIIYNVPTHDEVKLLIDNAQNHDLKVAIMLSAFGGLRRGEISALENTDIKGNTITINKDMVINDNNKFVIKPPKTYSSNRVVTLPQFVADELTGSKPCNLKPSVITDDFLHLRNKLGLLCRFHDLRHYFASSLHSQGIPDAYIMKMGGWSSDSTLKSIYRNALLDELEINKNKSISFFENKFLS